MKTINSRWHKHYVCDDCNTIVGTMYKRARGRSTRLWEFCPGCGSATGFDCRKYKTADEYLDSLGWGSEGEGGHL